MLLLMAAKSLRYVAAMPDVNENRVDEFLREASHYFPTRLRAASAC